MAEVDLRLGYSHKLWQSSFMMVRLMNTFVVECNAHILAKQTNLLQNFASGFIKTVTDMQAFKDDLLSDLDMMKELIVTCETIEDIHLDNGPPYRHPQQHLK